jgi:hypothetical protein
MTVSRAQMEQWLDALLAERPPADYTYPDTTLTGRGPTTANELVSWGTARWDGHAATLALGHRFEREVPPDTGAACLGSSGVMRRNGRVDTVVWLNPHTEWTIRPRVLAHELAHLTLKHTLRSLAARLSGGSEIAEEARNITAELEAEAVAALVARAAGCGPEAWTASLHYYHSYATLNNLDDPTAFHVPNPPAETRRLILDAARDIFSAGAVASALQEAA